jgi:hypothetical protein
MIKEAGFDYRFTANVESKKYPLKKITKDVSKV